MEMSDELHSAAALPFAAPFGFGNCFDPRAGLDLEARNSCHSWQWNPVGHAVA